MQTQGLFVFGLGYSTAGIARTVQHHGWWVTRGGGGTSPGEAVAFAIGAIPLVEPPL